jgi:hypothetical protein
VQRLEVDKARAEYFRTLAFLNTALLAGIAATVAFLPTPLQWINLLVVTVGANLAGIVMALGGLSHEAVSIGGSHGRTAASVRRRRQIYSVFASGAFGTALISFELFALHNL